MTHRKSKSTAKSSKLKIQPTDTPLFRFWFFSNIRYYCSWKHNPYPEENLPWIPLYSSIVPRFEIDSRPNYETSLLTIFMKAPLVLARYGSSNACNLLPTIICRSIMVNIFQTNTLRMTECLLVRLKIMSYSGSFQNAIKNIRHCWRP